MNDYLFNKRIFFILGFILILSGCGIRGCIPGHKEYKTQDYLIKVRDQRISKDMFDKISSIEKSEYSDDIIENPKGLQSIKLNLLIQLSEELLLLQKAADLGITVSDAELEATINEIKKDYPDDIFEKMFIANAVSYSFWEKRMKMRLIINKLIQVQLLDKVEIMPSDIENYYKKKSTQDNPSGNAIKYFEFNEEIAEKMIKNIKGKKAQDSYDGLIEQLKKEYDVEINQAEWEKVLANDKE